MITNGVCALYCLISAIAGGAVVMLLIALLSANEKDDDKLSNVGLIDGAETCVVCGRVIPEGCQVCGACMEKEETDVVDATRCKDCVKYSPYENSNKGWCCLHEHIINSFNFCEHAVKESEVTG